MSETARLTLTDFLLARIAEDEARFRRVEFELSYINLFDRLLAECEAKRRIVELRYSWNLQAERNPEPPFSPIFQTQVRHGRRDPPRARPPLRRPPGLPR